MSKLRNDNRLMGANGKNREGVILIRRIPADIKLHFKAYCARRGVSMTEWLVARMKEAIANEPKT